MGAIKHVLTERYYVWEDAVDAAQDDPEIDLSGAGPVFTPLEYLEDEASSEQSTEGTGVPEPQPKGQGNLREQGDAKATPSPA